MRAGNGAFMGGGRSSLAAESLGSVSSAIWVVRKQLLQVPRRAYYEVSTRKWTFVGDGKFWGPDGHYSGRPGRWARQAALLRASDEVELAAASDLELVQRARRGDASAFHLIVDRYARRLYGLAYSLLGDAADAEDAVQETLAGAYRGIGRFEERSSLWTWLARILYRQASRQRRRGRQRDVLPISIDSGSDTLAAPMPVVVASDVRLDLSAALTRLSADHREVIVLREIEQMSYEEIADVLGVPRGTVESRLHRARAELRKKLSGYLNE